MSLRFVPPLPPLNSTHKTYFTVPPEVKNHLAFIVSDALTWVRRLGAMTLSDAWLNYSFGWMTC